MALLEGPLTTLGVVAAAPGASELWLTEGGRYLLQLGPPPELAVPAPFHLGPDLRFTPPALPLAPLALATLALCGGRQDSGAYRITQASWGRALHRGESCAALLTRLHAAADRPLTGAEVALLEGWAREADRMCIRRLTVLEVTDPEILARLQAQRRGRRLVLGSLGPRAVAVDEGKLGLLVRRLAAQEGQPPRMELPPDPAPSPPLGERDDAAWLWLAARVYRDLGAVLPLPARLPHELLEQLAAPLTPGALAAVEAAAQRVREALQAALEGRSAFPVWSRPTLTVEEGLALIEEALAAGQALEMTYYTAGRDETTRRVVEPYRLERRSTRHGEEVYLVGFGQRAQAERVFRVDRIRTLALVPRASESRGAEDDVRGM